MPGARKTDFRVGALQTGAHILALAVWASGILSFLSHKVGVKPLLPLRLDSEEVQRHSIGLEPQGPLYVLSDSWQWEG